MICITIDKK